MRYLFATDGSRHAAKAFEYLINLARPARDQVHVVAVPVYLLAGSPDAASPPIARMMKAVRARARAAADATAGLARARRIKTTVSVPDGDRADEILAAAAAFRADLVVMGGGGLKGLRGAILGSTAAVMLERADRPLLIVKGKAIAPRRVLLVRRIESRFTGATVLRRLLPLAAGVTVTSIPAAEKRVVDRATIWNEPDLIAFEAAAAPRTAAAKVAREAQCPVLVGMSLQRDMRKRAGSARGRRLGPKGGG